MSSRKLIILFGIFYLFSVMVISYERFVLMTVEAETRKTEYALRVASEVAADMLKVSVYEEGGLILAAEGFRYAYAAEMREIRRGGVAEAARDILEIRFALNGKECNDSDFLYAKKGDEVSVIVFLKEKKIEFPDRTLRYERSNVQSRILD